MSDQKILLTQEWLAELLEKLRVLKEERRIEVAEKLKEAISFSDLSENAEYQEARDLQAQVELRISELEDMLKPGNYEIIDTESKKKNNIHVGNIVTVRYEKDGKTQEETYTIVGSQETNIFEKKISNESPLGKSLIGKRVNDTVEVRAPSGVMKYTITLIQ